MSALVLKWIAALSMLLDHAGILLFPGAEWMRIAGRLALPLYAYFIAEGFSHTHDRRKYFLRLFLLGAACQIVYAVAGYPLLFGILIDFSLALLFMEMGERMRRALSAGQRTWIGWAAAFLLSVSLLAYLCTVWEFDYGICGILLPVWPSFFAKREHRLLAFGAGLALLCVSCGGIEWWSLFALPLLFFYNGKPGKYRMKWFFYIFYPAHLVLLYGISLLLGR
jgi:hypothetical protein